MIEIRILVNPKTANAEVPLIAAAVEDFLDDHYPHGYISIEAGPSDGDPYDWHNQAQDAMNALIDADELAGTVNSVFNGG